ncbi:MAG: DUF3794 domain-containing protein [Oscillospiraceae bacterium]|nr:DUF3794 domain-containing protein [Oscillospiraceae bacterium]
MELDLQMQKISCYQVKTPVTEVHEESVETIIPDYCPDIARIIDSSACLFVRNYECADGRIIVHGTARVNVLYMADGGGGLKSFEFSLPLEKTLDLRLEESCTLSSLTAAIAAPEVRTLNPRKLLTRAVITFEVNAFSPREFTWCVSIPDREQYGIEILKECKSLSYIKSVCKKDFVFSEEIVLSATKDPIMEILRCRESLRLDESKVLGSKVMLKGTVIIDMLYLSVKGTIQQLTSELPFSQILDGCEGGQLDSHTDLWLSGAECHISDEDGKVISIKLVIGAFMTLYEQKDVDCICDLYSTSHRLEKTLEEMELNAQPLVLPHEISAKETLEVGSDVSTILSAEVFPGSTMLIAEDKKTLLRTSCTVKSLYIADNGMPYCTERRCELRSEVPNGYMLSSASMQPQKITAMPTGNGIEVRFTLSCMLEAPRGERGNYLTQLQVFEAESSEEKMPSIVLKRMQKEDSLWEIAKAYLTTADEILAANECTDESQLKDGQMLLIPKKR